MPTTFDNHCIDCGGLIWSSSIRCQPCHRKLDAARKAQSAAARRTDSPEEYYCIDCGVPVWRRAAKRCKACANRLNARKPKSSVGKASLAEKMRQRWADGTIYDALYSPEKRKHLTSIMKRRWKDGEFDDCFQSPTKPEKNIMVILEDMGIEYEFNSFRLETYPYDFYIPAYDLLIEYDGWYWHTQYVQNDDKKDLLAKQAGFYLLRLKGLRTKDLSYAELQAGVVAMLEHIKQGERDFVMVV